MTEKIPFEIMDDLASWRDPVQCWTVLYAGASFLYEELERRRPNSRLAARIRGVGEIDRRLRESAQADSDWDPDNSDQLRVIRELDALGTLGFSLWHLRPYMESVAFRHEFKQLSNIPFSEDGEADDPDMRGQGFMFFVAGFLARDEFEIEFVKSTSRNGESSIDFLAKRDGFSYPCEATSRYPKGLGDETVEEFWKKILDAVEAKTTQLAASRYENGVLLVDCSPIFDLVQLSDLPLAGRLGHLPQPGHPGPPGGDVPVLRYDDSEFCQGLRALEEVIRGSAICNLMLWNRVVGLAPNGPHRKIEHRVLGTIHRSRFWAYFPNGIVFPGPNVGLDWGE